MGLYAIFAVCFVGPNLIHFISFIGALVNSVLGFVIPVIYFWITTKILLYNTYFHKKGELDTRTYKFNIVVLAIAGLLAAIAVVHSAIEMFGSDS